MQAYKYAGFLGTFHKHDDFDTVQTVSILSSNPTPYHNTKTYKQ